MALHDKEISPVNSTFVKSYKSEENARKAILKVILDTDQFVIVRNENGRWSPLIITSNFDAIHFYKGFSVIYK